MARLLGGNAAKQQQCHKVRNGHEGIHAVGNVPDDVEVDDAAKEQEDDVKDAIEAIGLALLDVVDGTLAIVAPPKDGAEGKGQDAKGEQRCTDVGYLGEGYLGERRTVVIGYLGIRQDAADEHDTVRAQMMTVSQKVPVLLTSAWRTGLRVWAAAATMGAEPIPLSLENRPRAIP